MKFEPVLVDLRELIDDAYYDDQRPDGNSKYLFISGSSAKNDVERAVIQAISFEVRGEFGVFLNNIDEGFDDEIYWTKNQCDIAVNYKTRNVTIKFGYQENSQTYNVPLSDWNEALIDWKKNYLKYYGFVSFKDVPLSHLLGVLIMTQDLMADDDICESYMIIEAIRKCADRYGIDAATIRNDCKRVTGLYYIEEFYLWCHDLLTRNEHRKYDDFVMEHIEAADTGFREAVLQYLGIEM